MAGVSVCWMCDYVYVNSSACERAGGARKDARGMMRGEHRQSAYIAVVEQIAELQRKTLALEMERAKVLDHMRSIHAQVVLEVGGTKDFKGRLKYTDGQLRDAALTLTLDEHPEFHHLRDQERSLASEIREIAIGFSKLTDEKYLLMAELGIPFESEAKNIRTSVESVPFGPLPA